MILNNIHEASGGHGNNNAKGDVVVRLVRAGGRIYGEPLLYENKSRGSIGPWLMADGQSCQAGLFVVRDEN
jgi:hypothetical protein